MVVGVNANFAKAAIYFFLDKHCRGITEVIREVT